MVLYKKPFIFKRNIQIFSIYSFKINNNFSFDFAFEIKLNIGKIALILAQNIFPSGKSNIICVTLT